MLPGYQCLVRRCQIILHRANGLNQEESGKCVGMSRPMVIQWEKRFRRQGLAGLQEAKRSGRKPSTSSQLRDEKSQCQALERTEPVLPLDVRHVRTATHDYTSHGTITLFAALNYLDGKILHNTAPRHTHKEWLAFLKMIERETPGGLSLHLIDNYCTRKHKKVGSWIDRRNRAEQKNMAKTGLSCTLLPPPPHG